MAYLYNLSYDISEELAKKNQVKDILTREYLLHLLILDDYIVLDKPLAIYRNQQIKSQHIVINPVETTIVFSSLKSISMLVEFLEQYQNQMYYILTEVKEDVNDYLAHLHMNEEQQKTCDELVNKIIELTR